MGGGCVWRGCALNAGALERRRGRGETQTPAKQESPSTAPGFGRACRRSQEGAARRPKPPPVPPPAACRAPRAPLERKALPLGLCIQRAEAHVHAAEVVLRKQYVDADGAAGAVRLHHPPRRVPLCLPRGVAADAAAVALRPAQRAVFADGPHACGGERAVGPEGDRAGGAGKACCCARARPPTKAPTSGEHLVRPVVVMLRWIGEGWSQQGIGKVQARGREAGRRRHGCKRSSPSPRRLA